MSNFKLPTVAELKAAARDIYGPLTNIDLGVRERAGDPDSTVADINQWACDEDGNEVDLGDIYPVADELRRVRKTRVWPSNEQWDLYCYNWSKARCGLIHDGLQGNATLTFNPDRTWTVTAG